MIKLLLVDDEERVLQDLQKNMDWKKMHIEHVFLASSAREALATFELFHPDLVITDIEMVERSGLDLLSEIRERDSEVKVIFLTCHPEFDYMRTAIQLGSSDYLLKPVDYRELEQAIMRQVNLLEHGSLSEPECGDGIRGYEDLESAAKNYIQNHLIENMKVSDIADELGCSESHLMKIFKSQTGWSLVEYITMERMNRAGQLLRDTDWNISMISNMCGYEDSSYFSRVFRKITGVTPKEYRCEHRVNSL